MEMLAVLGFVLSIGAINALIPLMIIVILIVAAAGSTRGYSIFNLFGIAVLAGIGTGRGSVQGRSAAGRYFVMGTSANPKGKFKGGKTREFIKRKLDARRTRKAMERGKTGQGAGGRAAQVLSTNKGRIRMAISNRKSVIKARELREKWRGYVNTPPDTKHLTGHFKRTRRFIHGMAHAGLRNGKETGKTGTFRMIGRIALTAAFPAIGIPMMIARKRADANPEDRSTLKNFYKYRSGSAPVIGKAEQNLAEKAAKGKGTLIGDVSGVALGRLSIQKQRMEEAVGRMAEAKKNGDNAAYKEAKADFKDAHTSFYRDQAKANKAWRVERPDEVANSNPMRVVSDLAAMLSGIHQAGEEGRSGVKVFGGREGPRAMWEAAKRRLGSEGEENQPGARQPQQLSYAENVQELNVQEPMDRQEYKRRLKENRQERFDTIRDAMMRGYKPDEAVPPHAGAGQQMSSAPTEARPNEVGADLRSELEPKHVGLAGEPHSDKSHSDDPYSVLGVGRDATPDEINRAYRRISKETHPDMTKGLSEEEIEARMEMFDKATKARDQLLKKGKKDKGEDDSSKREINPG